MTHWNHRLIEVDDGDDKLLLLCEVFYDDDGNPCNRTQDAVGVTGGNVNDVRETLERMLRCLDKPILTDADLIEEVITTMPMPSPNL